MGKQSIRRAAFEAGVRDEQVEAWIEAGWVAVVGHTKSWARLVDSGAVVRARNRARQADRSGRRGRVDRVDGVIRSSGTKRRAERVPPGHGWETPPPRRRRNGRSTKGA